MRVLLLLGGRFFNLNHVSLAVRGRFQSKTDELALAVVLARIDALLVHLSDAVDAHFKAERLEQEYRVSLKQLKQL